MMTTSDQQFSSVPHTKVAIIGGGFATLMTFAVLRFRGVAADDIRIYSDSDAPERLWEKTIRSFRLTHMRSESIGHFFPTDSPGLATVDAFQNWAIKPLLLSWFDQYHPTVDFFLNHTRQITRQVGYSRSLYPVRIGWITKNDHGFSLDNEAGETVGTAQHLVIAVGHGPLRVPAVISNYRAKYGRDEAVVHSFEDKTYAPARRVLIVGDGLTSGTECANALQAGSMVYVLTRNGKYLAQALNTPRHFFSRRGIKPYRSLSKAERLATLARATRGTIKPYPMWMKLFKQAEKSGQLRYLTGELVSIEKGHGTAAQAIIRLSGGTALRPLVVDQVIVATGFAPASTHPLLRTLINDYQLPMAGPFLAVNNTFCISELSTPDSFAAVIGPAAAWSLPSADSLGGMKIIAHAIADMVMGNEGWHPQQLLHKSARWLQLVAGKELV